MVIDITEIDKVRLLQSLHDFGRKFRTESLSMDEAKHLIREHDMNKGYKQIDYVNGVAIKLQYSPNKRKHIVYTDSYDYRHGTYSFLYAFISEFGYDSLKVVKKGYYQNFKPGNGCEFNNSMQGQYLHLIDFERVGIKRPVVTIETYPPYLTKPN